MMHDDINVDSFPCTSSSTSTSTTFFLFAVHFSFSARTNSMIFKISAMMLDMFHRHLTPLDSTEYYPACTKKLSVFFWYLTRR